MVQNLKKVIPNNFKPFAKSLWYGFRMVFYIGKNVECPICESQFLRFASHGPKNKYNNALCLKCYSLERHRLLWLYLKERTSLYDEASKKMLHFGPEKVFYDKFLTSDQVDYYPCDIAPELYHMKLLQVDITNINFSDDFFDVVICNHVLEHIDDDHKAMTEVFRVLKKGGWAILQVPIDYNREFTYEDWSIVSPAEREKAFGQSDHVRYYGRDYKNRLARAGFDVTENGFINEFTPRQIQRFGFDQSELIYLCRKH